jgi:hypothetical protein
VLEVFLIDRRGSGWKWQVRDQFGNTFMAGREKTRQAARYASNRALFQLLAIDPKLIDLKGPM